MHAFQSNEAFADLDSDITLHSPMAGRFQSTRPSQTSTASDAMEVMPAVFSIHEAFTDLDAD